MRRYLTVPDATVAVARVDGDRHYRITANRLTALGLRQGRNYSMTALVSPRGLVRAVNVSYERERNERIAQIRYQFQRRPDLPVERPDWVADQWSTGPTESDRHYPRRTPDDGSDSSQR